MPDVSRRTVLAGVAVPVAAYLPWPMAEQWDFRWTLGAPEPKTWPIVRQLDCRVRFPDGHTQNFRKFPTVSSLQMRVAPFHGSDEMGYQVVKRAIEMKRDIWFAWRKRCGLSVDGLAARADMDAFSEDLSDLAGQLYA